MDRSSIESAVKIWVFAIASGELDRFDEITTEDARDISGAAPVAGRATFKARAAAVRAAFGEIDLRIYDLVVEEDRAAWRWTLSGAHVGAFAGVAPTSKKVSFSGVNFQRFENGRISEHWTLVDAQSIIRQLTA